MPHKILLAATLFFLVAPVYAQQSLAALGDGEQYERRGDWSGVWLLTLGPPATPANKATAAATDIPKPSATTEPGYYINKATSTGVGRYPGDARSAAREAARNAVRRCHDGDTQISSRITDGGVSEVPTRWFVAAATVTIRCRPG